MASTCASVPCLGSAAALPQADADRTTGPDGRYEFAHTANALLLDRRERIIGEIFFGEDERSIS